MKNFILKIIKWIALIIFSLSAFSLDSGSLVPTITLAISGIYLIIFGLANGWFEIGYESPDR